MPVLENAKQEKFVQCLIAGMSQRKAYRESFPNSKRWKDSTVDSKASELFNSGKILERYRELQRQSASEAVLTRTRKREILAQIAQDADEKTENRIKAIETDNKMTGEYGIKVEGELNTNNPFAGLTTAELRKLIDSG